MHPIQGARQVAVARHRQHGARDAEDQGEQGAKGREGGPDADERHQPVLAARVHRLDERRRGRGQRVDPQGVDHGAADCRIDGDRQSERERDGPRDGAPRVTTSSPRVAMRAYPANAKNRKPAA